MKLVDDPATATPGCVPLADEAGVGSKLVDVVRVQHPVAGSPR